MPTIRTFKAVVVASAIALGGGLAGTADAAMPASAVHGLSTAAGPAVTQAHWEYRGHHRFWVPDHRREWRHYDRR